ncbi:MAG: DEAD/DEAH box helicase [Mangrovibacterium sp.]
MTKISEYKNLLSFWHKLEHFTPSALPKTDDVKKLEVVHPWDETVRIYPKDPKKAAIIHTVYLGVFQSSLVTDFVKDYFKKDDTSDPNDYSQRILYASLKVDNEGNYLNDTLGISTLPWALGQLEKGRITEDNWSGTFTKMLEEVVMTMEDLLSEALSFQNLKIIQDCIVSKSEWSIKPETEIYFKTEEIRKKDGDNSQENEIKPELLNSFYIHDLENIINEGTDKDNYSKAFLDYLNGCLNKELSRIDLSKEINVIKQSLLPDNFPDGCWPSPYKPGLMQQFAVNTVIDNLSGSKGIFSVNGPPGTGKTTLLRGIVAGILVDRAKIMVSYSNPSSAFTKAGQIDINNQYVPAIYAPAINLCDGGIVVASSNNGAVENISKELPLKKEVISYESIGYFRDVSENCVDPQNWGLISAVLGNKENRKTMVNSIWFNNDEIKAKYTLRNVLKNNIPTDEEWTEIINDFKSKLQEVGNEKKRLQIWMQDYKQSLKVENEIKNTKQYISELSTKIQSNQITLKSLSDKEILLSTKRSAILSEISELKRARPEFFSYWFNSTIRKEYKQAIANVLSRFNTKTSELDHLQNEFQNARNYQEELRSTITAEERHLSSLENEKSHLIAELETAKEELGHSFANNEFWSNLESKESQETTPWYSDRLKKLQSELFGISMKVNELFILKANSISSRIFSTLAGFFHYLRGNVPVSHEEAKAMWNTFFLVMPVVSTTFASIDRMFGELKTEDLPWLFIDEAGQAVPQAAAGAIWRSKRVVVVGDPFQIEPVVTIPPQITDNLRKYFGLTPEQAGSGLSVQTMADRANKYGWYNNNIWVGAPLRVHRRCCEPMFSIANEIAYEGMMYNSTIPKEHKVNFSTQFLSVSGTVEGRHYVPEQAEIVIEILKNEMVTQRELPNIFVISPFTEIPYKLKGEIYNSLYRIIKSYLEISPSEMWDWLHTHIGTVHTFQGKQADGVILCLGLDTHGSGALAWASAKPNLLNVAITRAKYRFVAIGDKNVWLKQPYFNKLVKLG